MNAVITAAVAAGIGLGVVVVLAGLRGTQVLPTVRAEGHGGVTVARLGASVVAGLVGFLLTGWPVVAAGLAVGAWYGTSLVGGGSRHRDDIERAKAIAKWTRLVRDTISGSTAIQQALEVTALVGPRAIRPELSAFESRLRQMPIAQALELLRRDLDHADGDLVVVCLTSIATEGTDDAAALLSRLAAATDSNVRLREKTEAGRAGFRTSMRLLIATIVIGVVGVRFFFGALLDGYSTLVGQLWLLVVMATFAFGAWMMSLYARLESPERFSARSLEATP